jgi:glycerol kinase
MDELILAIDQGTTGTNVALYDQACNLRAVVKTEFRQIFPRPGWVEHDLGDIWASTETSIRAALAEARADAARIRAIGITNQRETTALWERDTGRPVHHAIVWQCRRTAPACQALRDAGHEPLFKRRTGLVLDAYFSGTKLAWLLDEVPGARARAGRGELMFGTIDTYLAHRLTGGQAHVTDVSNASRTLLMNLETLDWDEDLLTLLRVPREVLPRIRPSAEVYGLTRGLGVLPDGIPIAGMAGDQQAALFGQTCFERGQVKATYGTGAFVLMNTGRALVRSDQGLLTTLGWQLGDEVIYALEGSVFIAGAAVQWLRDGLGLIKTSGEVEALAASVPGSDGVVFVPALVGLGAPRWNPDARGALTGLTRGTSAGHIARAALEGIAFQVRDVVVAMQKDLGAPLGFLRVDGGACRNDLLIQFQSDVLGVEIHRPRITETTSLGAALLAGLATGVWQDREDIRRRWAVEKAFRPGMQPGEVQAHLARWEAAVAKA